jgi:cell division initiation protein
MPKRRRQDEEPAEVSATGEAQRITPVDIQQREFRLAFRGYHEGEVDKFLDELTEEVARLYAENKRLREELDFKRTERLDTHATGDADALLRQAREEAARIIDHARARASTMGEADRPTQVAVQPGTLHAATALLGPFLAREREFLQSLASLIQGHADAVKEGIRRARGEMTAAAPAEPGPGTDTGGETVEVSPMEDRDEAAVEGPEEEPEAAEDEPVTDLSTRDRDPGHEPPSWRSGDQIMDLTEDEVEVGEPAARHVAADDRDDRSIREFFWGED